MTRTATVRYNVTEDLRMPEEEMAAYLEATLEGIDPQLIAAAPGDIARERRTAQVASKAGPDAVTGALCLKLHAEAVSTSDTVGESASA